MIKIEETDVYGFDAAVRGMRNPMNSWDKSDSMWIWVEDEDGNEELDYSVGENDLKLMKSLSKAGNDHSKFLRMINVTCDITAPLYWWKEFDTYKVGTVANSCSTMHKIHAKEFTLDDFSYDKLIDYWFDDREECTSLCFDDEYVYLPKEILKDVLIPVLNQCRQRFLDTKDKSWWWQMIQLLPSSYNQKRTVQLNYEVLRNMDRPGRRRDHKLDEWREFCKWAETLPYFKEIVLED